MNDRHYLEAYFQKKEDRKHFIGIAVWVIVAIAAWGLFIR